MTDSDFQRGYLAALEWVRDEATQFPPITAANLGERFIDPATLDRPTEPERDVSTFRAALRDALTFAVLMLFLIILPALFGGL